MHSEKLAFTTHAVIETAAALSFIVHPEGQLPGCTPATRLVLRQYGGLLLASSMICLIIVAGSGCDTTTTRLMAAALGSYHAWPCYRAFTRIRNELRHRHRFKETWVLGGPPLHFLVHVVCLGLFLHTAITDTWPHRENVPESFFDSIT
ncbi:hypothetical protein GGR58DRAFT_229702 [Xylaria digitata]|nr:hypothetical protein GGR58DRAFT_229702 [Xylaria digitata]